MHHAPIGIHQEEEEYQHQQENDGGDGNGQVFHQCADSIVCPGTIVAGNIDSHIVRDSAGTNFL